MNTNKPKPPRKLLSETVVELKTNYPTALERLRELSGVGNEIDNVNRRFFFECNRKGLFSIKELNSGRYTFNTRTTGMRGGLYVEEGKTKAVVYTYRLTGTVILFVLDLVLGLVMVGLGALNGYLCLQQGFSLRDRIECGLLLLLGIVSLVCGVISYEKGKQDGPVDTEKMRQEALRRLSAVDDWEK